MFFFLFLFTFLYNKIGCGGSITKPILIIVAGGSASGKSTVVNEIIERLKSVHVAIIKHDDYYVDLTNMPMEERKLVNYDHPSSLDNNLLYQHLQDLLNNKAVLKPTYDFIEHNRNTNKELLEPKKVIILEGILSLVDKRIVIWLP